MIEVGDRPTSTHKSYDDSNDSQITAVSAADSVTSTVDGVKGSGPALALALALLLLAVPAAPAASPYPHLVI